MGFPELMGITLALRGPPFGEFRVMKKFRACLRVQKRGTFFVAISETVLISFGRDVSAASNSRLERFGTVIA